MKRIVYLFIVFCFYSCKGQTTDVLKIDVSKVKEINIINKVDCSFNKLVKHEVTITDRDEIKNIIETLAFMQLIKERGNVNMKVSNGFFEMSFDEGDKNHYFTIHYTVYDGVVIWSNDGGQMFKNDRLEIAVYKEFTE